MKYMSKDTRLKALRLPSLLLAGLLLAVMAGSTVSAATFQLAKGTELKVKFVSETGISSKKAAVGDTLMITLAEEFAMGDQILVAAGAPGKAVVSEIEKAKAPGKPGRIVVTFLELGTRGSFRTADGSPIALEGTVEKMGKGKKTLAFITIVGIFLIKGGQGEIPLDEVFPAKVAERTILTDD